MRSTIFVLIVLALGCKPTVGLLPPVGLDAAGPDAAGPDDAAPPTDAMDDTPPPVDIARPPADAGAAVECTGDRQCSALGMVCDLANGRCVGCNVQTDCVGGALCLRHACQVVTPCASSVTCPGQVCSTRLGFCVDCNVDGDCPTAQQCRESLCVDRPAACASSRECSAMGMVCDPVQSVCVECVADVDCGAGRYCRAARTCARQTCTPNETSCQDATRQRACNASGSEVSVTVCPSGQTCRGDRCQGPVCSPGAATCASPTARSVCAADGLTAATTPCPTAANVAAPRCAGAGACGFECNAGYGDCDGSAA
ncbi:MAG: hypothetical protein JWM10_1764, partial [Myxococcaceae bacterium]|nr:hypothetical protein [Myxococcaceae bacterium]